MEHSFYLVLDINNKMINDGWKDIFLYLVLGDHTPLFMEWHYCVTLKVP
jgi:hypothetical protein